MTPRAERNKLLPKLFFGAEAAAEVNASHMGRYRELQRGLLEKYKEIEKSIKAEYAGNPNLPYWLLTVRYGQRVTEAQIGWCDEALAKLKRTAKRRKRARG